MMTSKRRRPDLPRLPCLSDNSAKPSCADLGDIPLDIPQIYPQIFPRYPQDILKISPRYPQDISQDIPKRLPCLFDNSVKPPSADDSKKVKRPPATACKNTTMELKREK